MKKCPECGNEDTRKMSRSSDRGNKTYCEECGHKWLHVEVILDSKPHELATQLYIQRALSRVKEISKKIKEFEAQLAAMEENLERLQNGPKL